MNILADASLPGLAQAFPAPFKLSLYSHREELKEKLQGQDILLCRSTLKVDADLLKDHSIKYLATASSGTDHIDKDALKNKGIQLLSAKGSNAEAVADYVMSSLAFVQKTQQLLNRKAAVIGIGEVGGRVSQRLSKLGFDVLEYDPPKACANPAFQSVDYEALTACGLICVHAELHDKQPYPSLKLLSGDFLNQLASNTVIINASRGGIIDEKALLAIRHRLIYCVDVYENEPDINPQIIDYAFLCTPHIAGHSLEAKYEAVNQISRSLHQMAGLKQPDYATPKPPDNIKPLTNTSWQDRVLSFYDPSLETQILKQAKPLKTCFLDLRKAHNQRHDFSSYTALNSETRPGPL